MPKKDRKLDPYNYIFLIVIVMCCFVLITSGVSRLRRYSEKIANLFPNAISITDSENTDSEKIDCCTISFNQQETLAEVAERHEISVESLCSSLNIDINTNPNIKICELFDGCITD